MFYSDSMDPVEMSTRAQRVTARIGKNMELMVQEVEALEDPWDRALVAGWVLHEVGAVSEDLRVIRNDTVRELSDAGFSYRDMSQRLGLSTGRIQQMRHDEPGPRRRGKIEIAVEQKLSTMPASASPDQRMDTLFPLILSFRHGSRIPAKKVAAMLGLPVGTVTKPWGAAVKEFLADAKP